MVLADMHREDVKAELRKRYGSVAAFERVNHLPEKSVTDLLRGYRSARVERAIVDAISNPIANKSEGSVDSTGVESAHRLNAGAR